MFSTMCRSLLWQDVLMEWICKSIAPCYGSTNKGGWLRREMRALFISGILPFQNMTNSGMPGLLDSAHAGGKNGFAMAENPPLE